MIDASVAWACNDPQVAAAEPNACAAFLREVRTLRHRAVMTPDLLLEWRKKPLQLRRASLFPGRWLVDMRAHGLVDYLRNVEDDDLRERIGNASSDGAICRIMLNDVHLIEAALVTSRLVAALDEQARGHFSSACAGVTELRRIAWVNPNIEEEDVIAWLKRGAKAERDRMLGRMARGSA